MNKPQWHYIADASTDITPLPVRPSTQEIKPETKKDTLETKPMQSKRVIATPATPVFKQPTPDNLAPDLLNKTRPKLRKNKNLNGHFCPCMSFF